jgi:excisionase family DNA binding protein
MVLEPFVTVDEASQLYRVSRRTIERLIKCGDLPYYRIGRQIRLCLAELRSITGRGNLGLLESPLGTSGLSQSSEFDSFDASERGHDRD